MRIGGLQKFSIIDYPGELAAVIFTQGCNFRCPYCFNAELVLPERFQSTIAEAVVLSFLEDRKGQLEGVVVTGGEPTVQEDLTEFLQKIHRMGYTVKLDTNGSHPSMLKELIACGLVDYIAMDVKAPWDKYTQLAGCEVNTDQIKESIAVIMHSSIPHEFRTTAVKSLLSAADLQTIAESLHENGRYFIQGFAAHDHILDQRLLNKECFTEKEVAALQADVQRQHQQPNGRKKGLECP